MRGVKVGRVNREDLDGELFQIVQATARRFARDIERLGRRYNRLRAAADPGELRRKTEDSLMGLVGGHTPIARRKKNHKPFSRRRMFAMNYLELAGNEAGSKIVRVMPHDGGDFETLIPDDPDPTEVIREPSFWRRISNTLFTIHH